MLEGGSLPNPGFWIGLLVGALLGYLACRAGVGVNW
jgi:hypothetical protein